VIGVVVEGGTRGVVGDTTFGVLLDVTPGVTFVITLGVMIPFLVRCFRRPGYGSFVDGIIGCAFASFLFGWVFYKMCLMGSMYMRKQYYLC
jgi:alpha-1,3-glucosyltransferase